MEYRSLGVLSSTTSRVHLARVLTYATGNNHFVIFKVQRRDHTTIRHLLTLVTPWKTPRLAVSLVPPRLTTLLIPDALPPAIAPAEPIPEPRCSAQVPQPSSAFLKSRDYQQWEIEGRGEGLDWATASRVGIDAPRHPSLSIE